MNKEKTKLFHKNGVFSLEYDKETLRDMVLEYQEEIERLNNIINKAIEFIYENSYDEERETCIDDLWGEIPKLLDILKGSDKE